ncbi:uncharacterized protein K444DRAFT_298311 [Hyaloscypha bicolor E]|uniref:Clr5 domain-containing protein n=1 Tax=Hyaloscypha bicolor E TaxID=1095630 RepID=A0A2J6SEZ6_9HELO|nr:uncharacterized protein K444DRAFT_298311 [Hyaloscypha bicolor E]PMD49347.1 hypothetical protein K444DRAFT_298311 [Hyaloscypha bicolor E]
MDFVPGPFAVFRPDVAFKERWGLLKPYLHGYYYDEKLKLSQIIKIMKEQYGFDAIEPQYKYQFKTWGWKKNVPATKKAEMCEIGRTRASLGKSTVMKYKGQDLDLNKLRRYAKMASRKDVVLPASRSQGLSDGGFFNSQHPLGNTIFLRWNIPYRAFFGQCRLPSIDHPSPAKSDISVATPPEDLVVSSKGISSLSKTLNEKVSIDRAHLFLAGRINDLVKSMDRREKESTFTWLNQFWLFGFQTAKNWGRGPRHWTADNLGFYQHRGSGTLSLPNTPGLNAGSPMISDPGEKGAKVGIKPSQLCRWSIHVPDEDYEEVPSPPGDDEYGDGQNESSWKEWPQSWVNHPIEEKIVDALQTNSFSSLSVDEIPFSTAKVASAASKSPNEILVETVGFSIIAGNIDLLDTLLSEARNKAVDLSSLYPFHLAISYLRGSKTCCNLLDLLHSVPLTIWPSKSSYNSLGHTTIDNLMITILKSHTSTTPGFVDHALATENRFLGEEVDICGRWDADSECYREILGSGGPSVPFDWKHKFCHTSAQAICHCLDCLHNYSARSLETPSGLFLRYCSECGRKLQLLPLHTLVLTAFQLGRSGCQGEDLFGALACLLCLIDNGIDPCRTAHFSTAALLGIESNDRCSHEDLSPIDLAEQVPESMTNTWPLPARNGWQLFCLVLRKSHNERSLQDLEDREHEYGGRFTSTAFREIDGIDKLFSDTCRRHWEDDIPSCFGGSAQLGHIWAWVQAEFLSYRRLKENDPWTSEYFDMEELLRSLQLGDGISLGFLEHDMLKPYCRCGRFTWDTPHREQTAQYYFGNLDDYTRLTAIPLPGRQCRQLE